jgi:hypothetical protein
VRDPNAFKIRGANAGDFRSDAFGSRIWKCDHCGKESAWGDTWIWYGNVCKRAGWHDDGTMHWVACSDECAEALKAVRTAAKEAT